MHCMAGTWAFDLCLWVHFEVVVSERWIIGSRNGKSHYLCNDGDAMNRIFDTYHFLTSNHLSSLRPYESPTVEKKRILPNFDTGYWSILLFQVNILIHGLAPPDYPLAKLNTPEISMQNLPKIAFCYALMRNLHKSKPKPLCRIFNLFICNLWNWKSSTQNDEK